MAERRKSPPAAKPRAAGGRPEAGQNEIGLPFSGEIGAQLHSLVLLSRAFERQVGQALAVNQTDLSAMEHLMTAGSLTPSELSRRLEISTAATTLVVDRLVTLGHVRREPHTSDRRKVVVTPAPASVVRAVAELMPVIGGVAAITLDLTADDRAVIAAFLERVLDLYRDALHTSGDRAGEFAPTGS